MKTTAKNSFVQRVIVLVAVLAIYLFAPYQLKAASSLNITNWRDGSIYVKSDGNTKIHIERFNGIFDGWDTQLVVKRPDGTAAKNYVWKNSEPPGTESVLLTNVGDYQIIPTLAFRKFAVSSNGTRMVLQPNRQKRTFRDIDTSHSETKLYFFVPQNTPQFTFYGMISRADTNKTREVKLYTPDGSVRTTLTPNVDEGNWKSITITHPQSGFWAASVLAGGSLTEGGYWVDGVPNYFSPTPESWFEPTLSPTSVDVSIHTDQVLGKRGMIGAARLGEDNTFQAAAVEAFKKIGFEANEVVLSQDLREKANDNDSPFNTDLSKFDFSNKAVDKTITNLSAQPLTFIGSPASWLVKKANTYPDCLGQANNGDAITEGCLSDSKTHDEFAESVVAIVTHYLKNMNYSVDNFGIIDEPNNDPIQPKSLGNLFNTVMDRIRESSIPNSENVFLYPGSVTLMDESGKDYIKTLIDTIKPKYLKYIAIHPWQMGYPGYGNIYTTPRIKADIQEIMAYADTKGGAPDKKIIISELNARFGATDYQLSDYFDGFDQALWVWSALINIISTGRNQAVLYYPFAESGSIHNKRGMIYQDGSFKPSAYAAQFFMKKVQDNVINIDKISSLEVESLVTVNDKRDLLNVLLVNKAARTQHISIQIPNMLSNVKVEKITASEYKTPKSVVNKPGKQNSPLIFDMDPESLYSLTVNIAGVAPPISPIISPTQSPTVCAEDINLDGITDLKDYSLLLLDFLKGSDRVNPRTDINHDNVVDLKDYSILVKGFTKKCP